jgi:hypothetical protein
MRAFLQQSGVNRKGSHCPTALPKSFTALLIRSVPVSPSEAELEFPAPDFLLVPVSTEVSPGPMVAPDAPSISPGDSREVIEVESLKSRLIVLLDGQLITFGASEAIFGRFSRSENRGGLAWGFFCVFNGQA